MWEIPREIRQNRKLIGTLAKNDFKKKFAGSYLGIIWAFVQPIVTVFVYWFVFQFALNAGTQSTKRGIAVPYVLWLIAGLVPWFYFSDAFNSGTHALVEYNFLVKKVVFKISTLPAVKVVSSLFVHAFFILFMLIMYACYGMFPDLYDFLPGSHADCQHLSAGSDLDDPDYVEHGCGQHAGVGPGYTEAESHVLYCERIPRCADQ